MEELGYEAGRIHAPASILPTQDVHTSLEFVTTLSKASVNREICVLRMLSHPALAQELQASYSVSNHFEDEFAAARIVEFDLSKQSFDSVGTEDIARMVSAFRWPCTQRRWGIDRVD